MTRLRIFLFRLSALVRSRQMDREIDDEIASHLAEATEEYVQQGLSPEERRRGRPPRTSLEFSSRVGTCPPWHWPVTLGPPTLGWRSNGCRIGTLALTSWIDPEEPGFSVASGTPTVISQTPAAPTPEPTTLLMLGTGVAGIAGARRWRQRKT